MRNNQARRLRKIAVLVLVSAGTVMCQPDQSAIPEVNRWEPLNDVQLARVRESSSLPHGRRDASWAADLHTRAMQRWLDERRSLTSLDKRAVCEKAKDLARSFLPEIRQGAGVSIDASVFNRALEASGHGAGCESQEAFSLFRRNATLRRVAVVDGDTVVTGLYESYVPVLEGIISSAPSSDAAIVAVDSVLAQAASLPPADFEVLAAFGSLEAASISYWSQAGGSTDDNQAAMSIFRRSGFSWRAFAGADFAGAMTAAGAARVFGVVNPHLFIACVFGGAAVGSAIYAYPYVME